MSSTTRTGWGRGYAQHPWVKRERRKDRMGEGESFYFNGKEPCTSESGRGRKRERERASRRHTERARETSGWVEHWGGVWIATFRVCGGWMVDCLVRWMGTVLHTSTRTERCSAMYSQFTARTHTRIPHAPAQSQVRHKSLNWVRADERKKKSLRAEDGHCGPPLHWSTSTCLQSLRAACPDRWFTWAVAQVLVVVPVGSVDDSAVRARQQQPP